jgi:hypothetical protein
MKIKIFEGMGREELADQVNEFTDSVDVQSIHTGSLQRLDASMNHLMGVHTATVVYVERPQASARLAELVRLCVKSEEYNVALDFERNPDKRTLLEAAQEPVDERIANWIYTAFQSGLVGSGLSIAHADKIVRDYRLSDKDSLWLHIRQFAKIEVGS